MPGLLSRHPGVEFGLEGASQEEQEFIRNISIASVAALFLIYALIAIPATAGLKKADQKQLVQLLEPVARTWLAYKITQVQTLFEEQITGELLSDARNGQANCRDLMDKAAQSLAQAKEAQLK